VNPGSHDRAAEVVARALLELGATNLQAKLGAHVASFGDKCWQTDSTVKQILRRSDGRQYHRESIGRARRLMAQRGWIGSARIFPLQTPPGARFRSTHGTTSKSIAWKVLGLRNPVTRGERRERRKEAQRVELNPFTPPRPRRVALEPALVALVGGIGSMPVPPTRVQRSVPAFLQRPADRAREAQADVERRAVEQRRALEAWSRENETGPPT
jgi:hypothetical protein